jgi:hypothetical protein
MLKDFHDVIICESHCRNGMEVVSYLKCKKSNRMLCIDHHYRAKRGVSYKTEQNDVHFQLGSKSDNR